MYKRIITCSDGTWNSPNKFEDGKPIKTNVQRIFDYIEKRDPVKGIIQIKYYDEGVGAQGNLFTRILNGATGNGIDDNIKDAYKFICWNFEPSDEIYLFGFSRGAYTARSLAGLIRKCGIIRINDLDLIEESYKLYRDKDHGPNSDEAVAFRKRNSFEVGSIRFIGVWDTVGALGIPLNIFQWYNKKKYAFYDCALSSIVENAFHALAVDEKRKTFEPAWWTKSENNTAKGFVQTLEQRWFAGVHSNVGGGYPDSGLSDIALSWLFGKAQEKGLSLNRKFSEDFKANYSATIYPSASGFYSLLPKRERKIIADGIESFVDDSVYERMKILRDKYKPKNIPPKLTGIKSAS